MSASPAQVLVVDPESSVVELVANALRGAYEVTTSSDACAALSVLEKRRFDVVLAAARMPGASGIDLLACAKRCAADASVVLMSDAPSIPDAVAAIRGGAFDYVAKPLDADAVPLLVARALEHRHEGASQAADGFVQTEFREALIAAQDRASRKYLVVLMREFRGNVTRAAARAGMTRENLHRLMRKYGVRSETFKGPASAQGEPDPRPAVKLFVA